MSRPIIARVSEGIDTLFLNYAIPPLVGEPCTENCSGGFLGGHIDVDTDAPATAGNGFADTTTKHDHEFDKKFGQVYIDYFSLNQLSSDQVEIDDAISNENKPFFHSE